MGVYTPHLNKPHSSSWFSAACDATTACRNHYFHFYKQNKCYASEVKLRQASNC